MLKAPVLFLIFNRPEVSLQVFKSIAAAQPEQLFIAADGPRLNNEEDRQLCQKTRELVLAAINWPCKVETLFREENLGCRRAVSEGISWFFSYVEAGIILEDDCLASPDFFPYCQKMLKQYKDNSEVGMIGGTSFLHDFPSEDSYFFSKYIVVWGWATWRKKWALYQDNLKDWQRLRKSPWLHSIYKNNNVARYYTVIFDTMSERRVDTWDSNWAYALLRADQLVIAPTKNLISNIGFSGTFVNTSHLKFLNLPLEKIDTSNLVSPQKVLHNEKLDLLQFQTIGLDRFSLKFFLRVVFRDTWLLSIAYKIKDILQGD